MASLDEHLDLGRRLFAIIWIRLLGSRREVREFCVTVSMRLSKLYSYTSSSSYFRYFFISSYTFSALCVHFCTLKFLKVYKMSNNHTIGDFQFFQFLRI